MNLNELIKYRHSRSLETYEEALMLAREEHWNAVANRLYYSCFYLISALLLQNGANFSSHNGVKTEFHKKYIKTGIVTKQSGKTYSRLFNLRQEGDYLDFKRLNEEDVYPFIEDVNSFISEISKIIGF